MDLKDFLDLQKRYKNLLKRDDLILIIFAFLVTFITFSLLVLYVSYVPAFKEYFLYETLIKFQSLFLYPAGILMFLIYYFIGKTKYFKKNIILYQKKFYIKKQYYTRNNFLKLFDFQGFLINQFDDKNCLYLSHSSEGLITKRGFRNFIMSFEAKIFYNGFGIILHAKDLANYFMLRVRFDRNKDNTDDLGELFIIPHIRTNGYWEIQDVDDKKTQIKNGEIFGFKVISKNKWIKLIITKSSGKEIIKEFEYLLPNKSPLIKEKNNNGEPLENIISDLEFSKFGKVGFRAARGNPKEQAIIYDLKIEKYRF